jgi:GntR family transcriptional regulator
MGAPVGKQERIAADLRELIDDSEPGSQLPTEADLAGRYGVARGTVVSVYRDLESEGLLGRDESARRIVPRYVLLDVWLGRSQDLCWAGERPTQGADSWQASMRAAGLATDQDLSVVSDIANADVAARLGVAEGEHVWRRQVLRKVGQPGQRPQPHNEVKYWFPAGLADGTPLELPDDIPGGSIAWLEERWKLAFSLETSARPPKRHEAALLRIPAGWPAVITWRTGRRLEGTAMFTSMTTWPGHAVRLHQ